MPNPLQAKANGLEIEGLPIIAFEDDVSGNISNQWNIHYSMLWSCLGLPRKELEKMINVNFATTSQHASPMELMKAFTDMLMWVVFITYTHSSDWPGIQ